MSARKPERPYFEAWLRRTQRQLAASGRLSQVATVLASEDNIGADAWRARLRNILSGSETPSLDLLTRIDHLLAASTGTSANQCPPIAVQDSFLLD